MRWRVIIEMTSGHAWAAIVVARDPFGSFKEDVYRGRSCQRDQLRRRRQFDARAAGGGNEVPAAIDRQFRENIDDDGVFFGLVSFFEGLKDGLSGV